MTVTDKIAAHPYWVDRKLTVEEMSHLAALKEEGRNFKMGDVFYCPRKKKMVVFRSYCKHSFDGIKTANVGQIEIEKVKKSEWGKRNRDKVAKYKLDWLNRGDNRVRTRAVRKEWRERNPDKVKAISKRDYEKNKDRILKQNKKWLRENPEKAKACHKKSREKAIAEGRRDNYFILNRIRRRLRRCFREGIRTPRGKEKNTVKFLQWYADCLGINPVEGEKWHLDHLYPVSDMQDFTEEEILRINAPENVQWLSAEDNLKKGARQPTPEEVSHHLSIVAEWRATQKK